MRLRSEHFYVLEAMQMFGGVVACDMVRKALLRRNVLVANAQQLYSTQRVYTLLDQLDTLGMVASTWPIQTNGPAAWALTKRGLECLTQTHH